MHRGNMLHGRNDRPDQTLGERKMDKDREESFDFDNDEEFRANFYKNIERVLGDIDIPDTNTTATAEEAVTEPMVSEDAVPEVPVSEVTVPEAVASKGTVPEAAISEAAVVDEVVTENAEKPEQISGENTAADTTGNAVEDASEEATAKQTADSENVQEAAKEETAAASSAAEEYNEIEVDDELTDINNSLAEQISAELDSLEPQGKKRIFFRLQNGIVLTILCLLGFGFFFGFTKPGNNLLMDMGINIGGMIWDSRTKGFEDNADVAEDIDYVEEDDIKSDAKEIDISTIKFPNTSVDGRKEEGVYNILLLGEEAIGQGAGRGRTDVIVVATLNTNDNTIKLTSLMRDQLVQIPGFKDNKLNVAYEEGGIDLLYDTIAINFDLHIDGSVLVNFSHFEEIVDELGGLEITLTNAEARYLNSTNYISNPKYRNVVEGTQLMNGNQVLGYCRIRKRAAITGKNNDYGRTDRHRIVLNAIFDKCKSKSKPELAALLYKFLPMITTDIDKKGFEALLDAYLKTGATEIQQLRIPADGTFDDDAKVRGMAVLIPDYEENIRILHEFVFSHITSETSESATNNNTANGN